jgi:hypothetical protein
MSLYSGFSFENKYFTHFLLLESAPVSGDGNGNGNGNGNNSKGSLSSALANGPTSLSEKIKIFFWMIRQKFGK